MTHSQCRICETQKSIIHVWCICRYKYSWGSCFLSLYKALLCALKSYVVFGSFLKLQTVWKNAFYYKHFKMLWAMIQKVRKRIFVKEGFWESEARDRWHLWILGVITESHYHCIIPCLPQYARNSNSDFLLPEPFFKVVFGFFFIFEKFYCCTGYIVTFTKVLTMYRSWIHPSIIFLNPSSPHQGYVCKSVFGSERRSTSRVKSRLAHCLALTAVHPEAQGLSCDAKTVHEPPVWTFSALPLWTWTWDEGSLCKCWLHAPCCATSNRVFCLLVQEPQICEHPRNHNGLTGLESQVKSTPRPNNQYRQVTRCCVSSKNT
jgi:hypothetical protein